MEGLASTFENITSGIGNIFNTLGEVLSYINPFSENFILKTVIQNLGEVLQYINPFNEEKFFGYKIVDLFSNLLQTLFVPAEENVNGLVDSVKNKFSFIDAIKNTVTDVEDILTGAEEAPSLTIHLNSTQFTEEQDVKILDLSWYIPFKEYGDKILTAFIYAMFFWRIYTSLPSIISGVGGAINDVPAQISDMQAYRNFGFGRSASTTRHQDSKNGGVYRK